MPWVPRPSRLSVAKQSWKASNRTRFLSTSIANRYACLLNPSTYCARKKPLASYQGIERACARPQLPIIPRPIPERAEVHSFQVSFAPAQISQYPSLPPKWTTILSALTHQLLELLAASLPTLPCMEKITMLRARTMHLVKRQLVSSPPFLIALYLQKCTQAHHARCLHGRRFLY
jgi:hypothetical protein